MGKNSLSTIMQKISVGAKLSAKYTCHSVRATTITTLHQAGVASEDIVKVTKHKRVASLAHNIDDMPVPQRRHCSEILARTMGVGSKPESSGPVVPSDRPGPSRQAPKEMPLFKLTIPGLDSDDSDDQENQEPTKLSQPSNPQNIPQSYQQLLSTKAALSSLLPNATFNGSCVINVNFRQ